MLVRTGAQAAGTAGGQWQTRRLIRQKANGSQLPGRVAARRGSHDGDRVPRTLSTGTWHLAPSPPNVPNGRLSAKIRIAWGCAPGCRLGWIPVVRRFLGLDGALPRLRPQWFVEAHATVRAVRRLGPSVCGARGNCAQPALTLWAWRAIQQHDDRHESNEQGGKRKPIQPKTIGCKHRRQNTEDDARKHEQHRLISTPL